jgi:hypothetical protein
MQPCQYGPVWSGPTEFRDDVGVQQVHRVRQQQPAGDAADAGREPE